MTARALETGHSVCKHALWATMILNGQSPSSNLDQLPAVAEQGVHVVLYLHTSLCQTVRNRRYDQMVLAVMDNQALVPMHLY
jgi:hypothetical protein